MKTIMKDKIQPDHVDKREIFIFYTGASHHYTDSM